jgi:hypothetical protein
LISEEYDICRTESYERTVNNMAQKAKKFLRKIVKAVFLNAHNSPVFTDKIELSAPPTREGVPAKWIDGDMTVIAQLTLRGEVRVPYESTIRA